MHLCTVHKRQQLWLKKKKKKRKENADTALKRAIQTYTLSPNLINRILVTVRVSLTFLPHIVYT